MADQNLEQELIKQLSSDKRTLRIQAIVKLSRIGKSEAALKALSSLSSIVDREESFFVAQAIAKISQKISSKQNSNNPLNNNNSQFDLNNINQITSELFLSATKDNSQALLTIVRTQPEKIPEEVLPSVGSFLTKYGDSSDSDFIQNYLKNHNDNLIIPYINAAEKIDFKIIYPVLPQLLASKEPLVRSRAVTILRKIDQAEAERHFMRLLASQKAEDRLAALEISLMFPFERVKDYIIALIEEEKDPDVIRACATVLASNPSLDIALRILDVLETLPPNQRKPIMSIFNIVAFAISSAKILPAKEATPQELVKTWKKQRLKKFLKDLEIQLCTTTGPKRENIINWLQKNRNNPDVEEFIDHLALNPQTEDVYQRLSNKKSIQGIVLPAIDTILDQAGKAEPQVPKKVSEKANIQSANKPLLNKNKEVPHKEIKATTLPQTKPPYSTQPKEQESSMTHVSESNIDNEHQSNEPNKIEEKEIDSSESLLSISENKGKHNKYDEELNAKIQHLKQMDMQQFFNEKREIMELAESEDIAVSLRAEALNTLLRLNPSIRIKKYGLTAIEEEDPKLKAAGFKILERVSPDVLKEKLNDLLLSDDTNIRVRAIRFGLKINQENSILALQKLISSKDENTRSCAISCLALCPFDSVYIILLKALQKEAYPLVAKQIVAILLSNPDPVILKMLDKLNAITTDPNLEMIISQARNQLEEILTTIPEEAKNSNLQVLDIFDSISGDNDKPYSVENVQKLSSKGNSEKQKIKDSKQEESTENAFISWLKNPINAFLFISVILSVIGLFGYQIWNKINKKNKPVVTSGKYNPSSQREKEHLANKSSGTIPTNITMGRACSLDCVVETVISNISIVVDYMGQKIMLDFENNKLKDIKAGDKVSITCIPYRIKPGGVMILAKGKKISKNENSKKK